MDQQDSTPPTPSQPITVCIYFDTAKGGETERRLESEQFTNLGRKYLHDRLYLQSKNSNKHLPQSPFTSQFFQMKTFFYVLIVNQSIGAAQASVVQISPGAAQDPIVYDTSRCSTGSCSLDMSSPDVAQAPLVKIRRGTAQATVVSGAAEDVTQTSLGAAQVPVVQIHPDVAQAPVVQKLSVAIDGALFREAINSR